MTIDELEVGKCYYNSYHNEFMCIFKTDNWAVIIEHEDAHYLGYLQFIDQKGLDNWFNDITVESSNDYPMSEYLDEFKVCGDDGRNDYISNRDY